jgi:hypothetical protein
LQPGVPAAAVASMSSIAGMEKVAMSRFEADEYINDRYAAMDQRLQVCSSTSEASDHLRSSHCQGQMAAAVHPGPCKQRPGMKLALMHQFVFVGMCRSSASV